MPTSLRFARTVLNGFESYFADFQNITLAARPRFENADWQGVHAASNQRIDLYRAKVREVHGFAKMIAGQHLHSFDFWVEARDHYARLIEGHNNFEIAETFFNSMFCSTFDHRQIRNEYAFVFSSQGDTLPVRDQKILRSYRATESLEAMLTQLLTDYALGIPYEDMARDVAAIAAALRDYLLPQFAVAETDVQILVLESMFFRNKGAYIVGKLLLGRDSMPFVLPLLHTGHDSTLVSGCDSGHGNGRDNGHGNGRSAVYVDTILFGSDKVSVIFSFTRSYFMVDAAIPSQYVLFLQGLMPAKPISEIYSCMGYYKHGKTCFHRSAYRHIRSTRGQFGLAPGIKGMVMTVFTLPSYDFVFKVIKDRFTPPKDVTREQVMEKYRLVKRSDRAGRMADTQAFNNLAFARERFSEELMRELQAVCPSMVEQHGRATVIRHVYVERRMTPLNLYLKNATDEQLWAVMDEYGNAIKELAAANIFPGDMLLKNFGVTRHGRVVFYDYDEICPLLDCNFRHIPPPRSEDDELSGQPWFAVSPNDIFPQEFALFFSGNQRAREVFDKLHSDIYAVDFWQALQNRVADGHVEDFFPYRRKLRFPRGASTVTPTLQFGEGVPG